MIPATVHHVHIDQERDSRKLTTRVSNSSDVYPFSDAVKTGTEAHTEPGKVSVSDE